MEPSGFQAFSRTSEEIAGGNTEWLGATHGRHAVAVAIPFLLVRSRPSPEAVTPFPNRGWELGIIAHRDTVGATDVNGPPETGTERNDQNTIGNAFSGKRTGRQVITKTPKTLFVL